MGYKTDYKIEELFDMLHQQLKDFGGKIMLMELIILTKTHLTVFQ